MKVVISLNDQYTYNLYDDFGWYVDFEEMPSAKPRTNYITIPSRNGALDLTEVDGQVYYEPVEFALICRKIIKKADNILTQTATLKNTFHGKKAHIYLGSTEIAPELYYYDSRINISNITRDGLVVEVEMRCTAFPYRLRQTPVTATFEVDGTLVPCIVYGSPMPTVPSISCSSEMTLAFGDYRATIQAGDNIVIPNLVLRENGNNIRVTGTGTITFTYQRGKF